MNKKILIIIGIVLVAIAATFFFTFKDRKTKVFFTVNKDTEQSIVGEEGVKNKVSGEGEKADEEVDDKKSENKASVEEKEEEKNIVTEKETDSEFKIINNQVSWGFEKSSSRKVDTIIVHSSYNAIGGDKYDFRKLLAEYKEYGVSPHYVIDREGNDYLLVSEKNTAYHAGVSKMPDGRTSVNNFSIGIEIMTTESDSPSAEQYVALKKLIANIKTRYKIKYVLGHNQIAPGRKDDPWNFDWDKI